MQTKLLKILLPIMASVLTAHCLSKNFNEALENLNSLRELVYEDQECYWEKTSYLRSIINKELSLFYNHVMDKLKPRAEWISEADRPIHNILSLENQELQCFKDASRFIDQTMDFSGYQVSNCISNLQDSIDQGSVDRMIDATMLSLIDLKVSNLSNVLVDVMIGRNIYRQFNEIELLVVERYGIRNDEISKDLENFRTVEYPKSWEILVDTMCTCLEGTLQSVKNALSYIEASVIESCRNFEK